MHCFICSQLPPLHGKEVFVVEKGEKSAIHIQHIEELKEFVYTNASGRAVVIRQAHLMTETVQNKLLKMLEEPPQGVVFYLVTEFPDRLLSTVRSRAVTLRTQATEPTDFRSVVKRPMAEEEEIRRLTEAIVKREYSLLYRSGSEFSEKIPMLISALRSLYVKASFPQYEHPEAESELIERADFADIGKWIHTLDEVQRNLQQGSNPELEADRFFIKVEEYGKNSRGAI